ncbi:MAG: DNA helicase [Bacteroidales bacterium]|nr:DNA helicase [Bacteroidales bacterium]
MNQLFADLQELIEWQLPIRSRYEGLYRILVAALNQSTRELTIEFSGTFARLDFLCRELSYKELHPTAYRQICSFRSRCSHLSQLTDDELSANCDLDVRALCEFLAKLINEPLPDFFVPYLKFDYPKLTKKSLIANSLRCFISGISDNGISLTGPLGEDFLLPWHYAVNEHQTRDLDYLRPMIRVGTQLNLVRPWEDDGLLLAEQVIFEPDILIDITSIVSGFGKNGKSVYNYLLNLLEIRSQTSAMLLGNLAGQMLDEEVRAFGSGHLPTYVESLKRFFADNALAIVACSDFADADKRENFHENARRQQQNIRNIVHSVFAQDRTIKLQKVILEPSFYCEMLGIQGRIDLLQSDKHVLMEQKSGKMDEYRHTHEKQHYIQMLLYQAMLHYAYHDDLGRELRNDDIASYLLYSLYPEGGLLKEAPAPLVLDEALEMRNQIAYLQLQLSRGEAKEILEGLTPEMLKTEKISDKFWEQYIKPRIAGILNRVQKASAVEKDFFYRMLTFEAREHILAKVGTSQREASGFAALWNCTSAEKREAGNLMDHLQIAGIEEDMRTITLVSCAPDMDDAASLDDNKTVLPNFRKGDIVVLYAYVAGGDPDARRDMVFRANIAAIRSDGLMVRLRAPQREIALLKPRSDIYWAVEHDFMESSFTDTYRSLSSFLEATPDRRALLLGQRDPRIDRSLKLQGNYGTFNELVLKAKQAQDYFLLIGPPGTGKTSCGLVNILRETLISSEKGASDDPASGNILLVSYTNRAVDEICSKLQKMEVPYLRIGSHLSCAEEYRSQLLVERCQQCRNEQEIRQMIESCRIVVGTTAAVTGGSCLFNLKQFELCIVDEASQILEPQLLAILSAKVDGRDAIRKFVMIGDHKQLPAVVTQTERESEVHEPLLREIGLQNCRQSLFERLIRTNCGNSDIISAASPLIYTLSAQGRMHHDVAAFANHAFYSDMLREIPLAHQQRAIPYRSNRQDKWSRLLTTRRISFINVKKERELGVATSDKVNQQEATLIAQLVHAVWLLFDENHLTFNPAETVGVIVPYRHQISTIRKELEQFNISELPQISIDTVERFQGSQRDIIIYGFTVSRPYQLDFLTNNRFVENGQIIDRKLNVALTRARELQILMGDADLLRKDAIFAALIDNVGNCI